MLFDRLLKVVFLFFFGHEEREIVFSNSITYQEKAKSTQLLINGQILLCESLLLSRQNIIPFRKGGEYLTVLYINAKLVPPLEL